MDVVRFDSRRVASLDGDWDFHPSDCGVDELDGVPAVPIRVPGLWEAQGHLELDGAAWYRRRFSLADAAGHWTLRFGAVMDIAEVYLNATLLGRHESPFTPFEFDARGALRAGENVLAVRVVDPALGDPEHLRLPHGKQGWMNHVLPSRPSLYMTYGGIWQPVTLRRHGPLVVREVFVNADPDDLVVEVELENRAGEALDAVVAVATLGAVADLETVVPAGGRATLKAAFGATTAPRWSIERPVLHDVLVDAGAGGRRSDGRTTTYGLRTVRVEGDRILVDGSPYRMKSALVQGFTADALYAEGSDAAIEHEVRAAKDMGFNTLRLHIKAFDPRYLDVCDRVGMYLHCDLPVAEPIEHEEMGGDTLLTRRCVQAVSEQVRRDRNHPSIILWSAMNELCDGRREARGWERYEAFARTLVAAVHEADGTRPVIENDWIEPDPDHVYASPILTAHWYGQLHADYLATIEAASRRWAGTGRPFFVTEFGDWGLPQMPELPEPPFWDARAVYAAGLAGTLWPATVGRFVTETQRYQGISDRLQTEVWRRHGHIGGFCLTGLTDVPQELNGLLDLHRRPKPLAVAEVRRANQVVLPMLALDSLVAGAGQVLRAPVHVANDGPELVDVVVELQFAESVAVVRADRLAPFAPARLGHVSIAAPYLPGSHDLVLRLRAGGQLVAENRYPIHVVDIRAVGAPVRLLGGDRSATALAAVGAVVGGAGTLVVGEGDLDEAARSELAVELATGATAVVLAQGPEAATRYPLAVALDPVVTAWGSTVFRFTTDHGALSSLPRRNVLVAEDSTVQAVTLVTGIGTDRFPEVPVVIAYKPVPGAMAGTIVGSHPVGAGRLVLCQYRLCEQAAAGDASARALLADVIRWAAVPRPTMVREAGTRPDGRRITSYRWRSETGR